MKVKHLVVGALIIGVGALLAAYGYVSGGAKPLVWDRGLRFDQPYQKTMALRRFSRLEIDLRDYDVTVQVGDHYALQERATNATRATVTQDGKTLRLVNHAVWTLAIGGQANRLILTVPTRAVLSRLRVTLNDGQLRLVGPLTATATELAVRDGDVTMRDLTLDNPQISVNDGNILSTDNVLTRPHFSQHDGNLTSQGDIWKQASLTARDGDVKLINTRLKRANQVQVVDGDQHYQAVKVDGVQLSAKDGDVSWFGKAKAQRYTKNPAAADRVTATAHDGDISFK